MIPAGITQAVSGNSWTNFSVSNNLIVSINPQGQDLGSTTVKVFRNAGPVRNNSQQYYLDRNIVITPATAPGSNVLVRFYFTDDEAKTMINATNCESCTKPADPYLVGITQYSGNASEENGLLSDNVSGTYQFISPSQVTVDSLRQWLLCRICCQPFLRVLDQWWRSRAECSIARNIVVLHCHPPQQYRIAAMANSAGAEQQTVHH